MLIPILLQTLSQIQHYHGDRITELPQFEGVKLNHFRTICRFGLIDMSGEKKACIGISTVAYSFKN